MNKQKIAAYIVIGIALLFVWFFTNIVVYILIAALISALGIPLKNILLRFRFKKLQLPEALASAFSLMLIIGALFGFLMILIPIISSQSEALSQLNIDDILAQLDQPIHNINSKLQQFGLIHENKDLKGELSIYLIQFMDKIYFAELISQSLSFLGSLFIATFSILFMSFFFIKDETLFLTIILLFVPQNQRVKVKNALKKVRQMLSKYVLGLVIEVITMMTLITLGSYFIGLENALLIGFICGLLNVIPYVGPLVGGFFAAMLTLISTLKLGFVPSINLVYSVLAVVLIANLIDSFILQPLIYSKSVKAHPLEIFVIILVGGSIAGPIGMILAIPTYTILRITAKEFLGENEFIKKLTKEI